MSASALPHNLSRSRRTAIARTAGASCATPRLHVWSACRSSGGGEKRSNTSCTRWSIKWRGTNVSSPSARCIASVGCSSAGRKMSDSMIRTTGRGCESKHGSSMSTSCGSPRASWSSCSSSTNVEMTPSACSCRGGCLSECVSVATSSPHHHCGSERSCSYMRRRWCRALSAARWSATVARRDESLRRRKSRSIIALFSM